MLKIIKKIHQHQKGITGLETAIILIAFIVVASVFAYTVLSAGLFSSQKATETTHSGLATTQATMELKGSVIAYKGTVSGDECVVKVSFTMSNVLPEGNPIDLTPYYYLDSNGALASPMVSNCSTAWTASTNVTSSVDASDYKEAPQSAKFVVEDAFTTGLLSYYDTPTRDLTAGIQVSLWVKPSANIAAGVLQLLLCSDNAGATPVGTSGADGTLDLPALSGGVWEQVTLTLPDPSALGAIESIGLSAASDPGAVTVRLDEVRIVMSGSSASGKNLTMIAYDDANIVIDDVAWTVEFAGGYESDGDYLLENTEKATVTVWLQNYNGTIYSNGSGNNDPFIDSNSNHLKSNGKFHLQVMPPSGATLLVERRTPAYLNPVMPLH